MNSEEAFAIWAPAAGPWSPWAKPILFANESDWESRGDPELPEVPEPTWLEQPTLSRGYREEAPQRSADLSTAMVLDLPGSEAVPWALAFARKGWRPVPLYNAVPGGFTAPAPAAPTTTDALSTPMVFAGSALIDVSVIVRAMRRATPILRDLAIATDRPPVFLLDADRRVGVGMPFPGRFDNRSISLPTDFPSAVRLRSRGIERVLLVQRVGTEPQEDLAHTLLAWQEGGLSILVKPLARDDQPQPIQVTRPSMFRVMWYRFLATAGLKRSPLGGFGRTIPVPSAG